MAQGFWSSVTSRWLGSVGNDQGDGNDNGTKAISLKKQNNFARASRIFVHFFYLFFILNYDTVFQNSTPENFGDIWKNGKDGISAIMVLHFFVSLFKWRLRSRRRRCCLGSLFSRTLCLNWTFKLSMSLHNNNNKKQLDQAPFHFVYATRNVTE